jgi:hypothetical protein
MISTYFRLRQMGFGMWRARDAIWREGRECSRTYAGSVRVASIHRNSEKTSSRKPRGYKKGAVSLVVPRWLVSRVDLKME